MLLASQIEQLWFQISRKIMYIILYYETPGLMFSFYPLLDMKKNILEIKTKPKYLWTFHSQFICRLFMYNYIYTRYVLALIFLVLLGKSELETLSCFLFNNLFQGIPRNFRIIQFKTPWRVPLRNSPPTATHNHLIIVKNLVAKWLYCFAYSYSNNDILADPFSIG